MHASLATHTPGRMAPAWRRGWLLAAAVLCSAPAAALDLSWTGFGTLGYAQSNRDYAYHRFIDAGGTFKNDSVLGGQVDARITPEWSATLQVQLAPSGKSDDAWSLKPSLAFVAWRPNDDWLARAGRFRAPLLRHSETAELGTSYDMVRLPTEVYGLLPIKEFDGLYISRFWSVGERELSVEAFGGSGDTTLRAWSSNGLPPVFPPGPIFNDAGVRTAGLTFTLRGPSSAWRLGAARVRASALHPASWPAGYPRVDLAPGVGYWQVSDALPGPGVQTTSSVALNVFTAGLDVDLGDGWNVAAELARVRQSGPQLNVSLTAGYVALSRKMGDFTPYVSFARALSDPQQRSWYANLSGASLPAFVPNAAAIVAAQRATADTVTVYDQRSLAVGTSYRLNANSKLKIEWMRTHIGLGSTFVDNPAGKPPVRNSHIDVFSLNYSFVF